MANPTIRESQKKLDTPDLRSHYAELDALRGVAIIGVVLCHIAANWVSRIREPLIFPLLGADALELMRYGLYGVSLFFLLSGYLLAWTEGKRAKKASGYSLRTYATRRALRLVPAYYVSIIIVCLTWPAPVSQASLASVLWHASFLHGLSPDALFTLDGVYWSLTAEVTFYFLLPVLVLRLQSTKVRLALFALLTLVSLGTKIYLGLAGFDLANPVANKELWYLYFLPTTHLYLFVVGMLLRTMVERQKAGHSQARIALALFAGSVLVFTAFPYAVAGLGKALQPPLGMLVDLAVVAFFASALLGAPLLRWVLAWRPLAYVGTVSYSLFLLHNTVLNLFFWYLMGYVVALRSHAEGFVAPFVGQSAGTLASWLTFFAYASCIFAAAGALSYLSYRYIESPFLRYKPR